MPGGANTQLLRYYGAAYPAAYRGSLFLDNWGQHGFAGANRAVFRYVPDDAGRIVAKEPFLWSTDPHFRPAHIALDPDGNMLVADWYGRDDESDLTAASGGCGKLGRTRRSRSRSPTRRRSRLPTRSPDWARRATAFARSAPSSF